MIRYSVILGLIMLTFSAFAQSDTTFNYTGSAQTYTVPEGVMRIEIDAYGARGGHAYERAPYAKGGKGGRVQAVMDVTPGEILHIFVGGRGQGAPSSVPGWNGGGNVGGDDLSHVGSGGGATDIRIGGTSLNDRVLVAGAGGGARLNTSGGAGGGLDAGDGGHYGGPAYSIGKGGTQTAGGEKGCWWNYESCGTDGGFGLGGNSGTSSGWYGGAGGGGWYGGGGGTNAGGGGGSSYTDANRCTDVTHTQGVHNGHGQLIITPRKNCLENITLNETIDDVQYYQAANTLNSSQVLMADASVTYKAGTQIKLSAGFSANTGADFHAYIESCSNDIVVNNARGARTEDNSYENLSRNTEKSTPFNEDFGFKAFPNPFHTNTTIEYTLKNDAPVILTISDLTGRNIARIVNQTQLRGSHTITFDAQDLPPGMYLARLQVAGEISTLKLMVLNK